MIAFARACEAIAATPAKLEKTALLAGYLRSVDDDDLTAAARFFTGNAFGSSEQRTLSVGGRTLLEAARRAWDFDPSKLARAYRATGDLGDALAPSVKPAFDLGLFTESLSPSTLKVLLDAIADARGPSAGRRRLALCERILRACGSALEARFTLKLLLGELRIGLREGLVLDAIALAFDRDPKAVRAATMAVSDVGAVALAARRDALGELGIRYGTPFAFMLATPLAFGSSYRELSAGTWLVEDKYDGIRAQAHKRGRRVEMFSRTHSEIGRSFPEVVAAFAEQAGDFIVDGEIVAHSGERVLPFRYLQQRLARVDPGRDVLERIPAIFVAFDAPVVGSDVLIDRSVTERRAALKRAIVPNEHLSLAPETELETGDEPEALAAMFEAARSRGNEGLVLKRTDSPYAPGRRGKWWLKLKRELTTSDVVVVAVEWGHGKRHKVLSDYTFAVRAAPNSDRLLTIGKAYTGLTDAEIAQMTEWFLEHRVPEEVSHAIAVEPSIVIEVAFDIVQRSALHESGFALRFPRIVRLRPDKPVSEIDTLADVERIYEAMVEREGVDG